MMCPYQDVLWGMGLTFGVLAALIAYIITYEEWIHHYPTKKEPRKFAWQAAIAAFFFFLTLSLIAGWLLTKLLR